MWMLEGGGGGGHTIHTCFVILADGGVGHLLHEGGTDGVDASHQLHLVLLTELDLHGTLRLQHPAPVNKESQWDISLANVTYILT